MERVDEENAIESRGFGSCTLQTVPVESAEDVPSGLSFRRWTGHFSDRYYPYVN